MIKQMQVLLRVKELKLDQAFRAMQLKRQQLARAEAARQAAQAELDESTRTLAAREDAIYADILGRVIGLDGVDDTHARVEQLNREHGLLNDALERALHVEHRAKAELETATAAYHAALKHRDKFSLITDDLVVAAASDAAYREEAEVEDLFSRPRARAA